MTDRRAEQGGEGAPAAALAGPSSDEILIASRPVGEGVRQTTLSVPTIHCGGCIRRIETALNGLEGVENARVNLSTKRVNILWREAGGPPPLAATLDSLGFPAHLFEHGAEEKDRTLGELIRALGVAGFAASNIMLLSVSVWSGADAATRDLFHWISALIAFPTLAYSGRIFFRSAWSALRRGTTNMDVPISIGVSLAFALSLYDTIQGGQHAYFDASVTLLFFLLTGRTLDHMMRERARVAVKGLERLAARGAMVAHEDGGREYLPVGEIRPGMHILLAAGERVPVDGEIIAGASELDCSLVTGESAPQPAAPGAAVQAGTLNLTAPLTLRATAAVEESFLAEMVRLMEAAESGRSRYRRVADRAARLYAPLVHLAAFLTFIAWMVAAGDLHRAVTVAVAVLIITCPCALGLAMPMVQVVATRRLFENGVMVKDGAAMERLAGIDTVVFDKTGTLTMGRLRLRRPEAADPAHLAIAAAMGAHSRHPHSRALASAGAAGDAATPTVEEVSELPGYGLEAVIDGAVYRLGRPEWALSADPGQAAGATVLARQGRLLEAFRFEDRLRPDAREAVAAFKARGLSVSILSGDHPTAVAAVAAELGISDYHAAMLPAEKVAHVEGLAAAGRRVLMVGDGLNDAPALAAARVSIAPASAADVGRNAADFVFLRDSLAAAPLALDLSERAGRLIRQNFALAVIYNIIAVPIAMLGYLTPLIAAVAMSGSSVVVVANALRLRPSRIAPAPDGRAHAAPRDELALEPAE